MLSDRQKLILKAIVEEFVKTAEPVGSKFLTDMPYLDFSSATLRFEMARLEELGYLEKTHTSSGRVPSEAGYKYYVENLVTRDYDVVDEFPLIDQVFKNKEFQRDEAIKEALNVLSKLTNYTAVVLGPSVEKCLVKKLELIPLTESMASILVVTNQGHVQNETINLPEGMNIEELRKIVATLDDCLRDMPLSQVGEVLSREISHIEVRDYMNYQEQLVNSFLNAFSKFADENFYLSGVSNIFNQPEFNDLNKIKTFLDIMDKRSMLKLLKTNANGLSVSIGQENIITPMKDCTVISIPYRISDEEFGTIALIGPTRMEYRRVIPLVEYLATNLSKLYKK